jgi:hypothetical protein
VTLIFIIPSSIDEAPIRASSGDGYYLDADGAGRGGILGTS